MKILSDCQRSFQRLARHRWLAAGVGGTALFGMMTAFALVAPPDDGELQRQTVLEHLALPQASLIGNDGATYLHEERIQSSDTVASLLNRLGINDPAATAFIRKDKEAQIIHRQLRPGKIVSAKTGPAGDLIALYFPLNARDEMLVVEAKGNGAFSVRQKAIPFETHVALKSGEIRSSLFGATDAAGIPDAIAVQLAEIFAGDIDFYRDLRKGDRFSLVYETLDYQGQTIRTGRILSAEFVNNQKTYTAFWFQSDEHKGGYYSVEGKSLRKAFLRSPLEFSRVTSGFSNARLHPVLQTVRAHKGIDYAAPTGTRVRAVADAVVEFAGRQSGYGNLIVLKHQSSYSTAYGHLNGFASGIRKGARVSQGDTIGYVGQTGLATGPHLHYEFRINSQQINPLSAALPVAIPLDAAQLSRFKTAIQPALAQMNLLKQTQLATAE